MFELHPWALDGVEEVPAQQKVEHEEGEEGERPPDVVHVVSSSRGKRLNTLMVRQQLYILQNEGEDRVSIIIEVQMQGDT